MTRRPDLLEFLKLGIQTEAGQMRGAGALVQILIVLLAFAIHLSLVVMES